jgi:hypothetical protein
MRWLPAMRHRLGAQLHDGQACERSRCRRRQWRAERDGDRPWQTLRHLPEELAALETEDAAPDAIEIDRNDRHVEAGDDALEAALEGEEVPGSADGALDEDADHVPATRSARARSIAAMTSDLLPDVTGMACSRFISQ